MQTQDLRLRSRLKNIFINLLIFNPKSIFKSTARENKSNNAITNNTKPVSVGTIRNKPEQSRFM